MIFRYNMLFMKMISMLRSLPIMLFLLLLMQAGPADGSYWFQVIDVSPIRLASHEEANFTVSVKGLGSQGAYVELVFKNLSQGLTISCPKMIKYVLPTGVTKYNCTIRAGDLAAGNYSFVVDAAAAGAPSGKRTAYVEIMAGLDGRAASPALGDASKISSNPTSTPNQTSAMSESRGLPGAGAILTALAILALWRMRR
jgi:hypothetical protein